MACGMRPCNLALRGSGFRLPFQPLQMREESWLLDQLMCLFSLSLLCRGARGISVQVFVHSYTCHGPCSIDFVSLGFHDTHLRMIEDDRPRLRSHIPAWERKEGSSPLSCRRRPSHYRLLSDHYLLPIENLGKDPICCPACKVAVVDIVSA